MAGAETTSTRTEGKTDGICTREVTSNRKTEDTVLKTPGRGVGMGVGTTGRDGPQDGVSRSVIL